MTLPAAPVQFAVSDAITFGATGALEAALEEVFGGALTLETRGRIFGGNAIDVYGLDVAGKD